MTAFPSLRAWPVLSLTLASLTLVGCQTVSDPDTHAAQRTPGRQPVSAPARKEASGAIVSTSEADGKVLVELPIGSADGVEMGAFFRVYDLKEGSRLKGIIQVNEILDPHRSIAHLIALTDRTSPLQAGDHAHEVEDLTQLASGSAIEQSARAQHDKQEHAGDAQQQQFVALRQEYQSALANADIQHQAELDKVHQADEARIKELQTLAAHNLEMKQLEERTELAALKSTMTDQVAAGIAEDHKATANRMNALVAEKDALQAQIDGLLKQQGDFTSRITALVSEIAEHDSTHKQALNTEIETREVLTARINELEARVAGKPIPTNVVLASEPGRSETVLDRLTRITKELANERALSAHLQESLNVAQHSFESSRQAVEDLQRQMVDLKPQAERAKSLSDEMATTRIRLSDLQQQRDSLELRRLQAERELYDLASRVLRLTATTPQIEALQAHLREMLGPAGTTEPEHAGAAPTPVAPPPEAEHGVVPADHPPAAPRSSP